MNRRKILQILAGAVAFFVAITGFSAGRYVLANPNEPLQQNLASWARNKGLGGVVDQLDGYTTIHLQPHRPTHWLFFLQTQNRPTPLLAPQHSDQQRHQQP
jgi:hypothetical protein